MAKVQWRGRISLGGETVEPQESEMDIQGDQSNNIQIYDSVSVESFRDHPHVENKKMKKGKLHVTREFIGRIVNSRPSSLFILWLIIINSILMGISTFDFVSKNPEINRNFEKVDFIFLIMFTVEAGLKIFHEGRKSCKDSWLVFDTSIVIFSWLLSGGVTVVRALRVLRALRLIARVSGLRALIETIGNSWSRLLSIFSLMLLFIYVFGVLFCEMLRPHLERGSIQEPYFLGLRNSLITVFQMMVFDNWSNIAREVIAVNEYARIPIVIYISVAGLLFTNFFVAVLVSMMHNMNEDRREKMIAEFSSEKYVELVTSINDNYDNSSISSQSDLSRSRSRCKTPISNFTDLTVYSINLLDPQFLDLMNSSNATLDLMKEINRKIEQHKSTKRKRKRFCLR
jgi:voltage-gated sodium channel